MSDPRLDAGRTVAVNRLPFGGAIQTLLQFGEMLGGFVLFPGLNQRKNLLLGSPGGLQQGPVHLAFAQGGAGLFGGRGSISHKRKECLIGMVPVNP